MVDFALTPKRKAIQIAVVNLIHCRRVRRRDLLAKGHPPNDCLLFNENSVEILLISFFIGTIKMVYGLRGTD
jgi:hypothetical protein